MTSHFSPKRLLRAATVATMSGVTAIALVAPAMAAPTGPDVASWQHPSGASINWSAVKQSGRSFAFVKATEGLDYTNPHYLGDSIEIKAAGLHRGTYHYADVRSSATLQALKYAALTLGNRLPMDMPPVVDFENSYGRPPAHLQSWLREFLGVLETAAGRKPIIYTYPSFWRSAMANTREFADYPLWIADYNGQASPTLPLPGGWTSWALWQYTDKAGQPGIIGGTDMNIYSGATGALGTFAAGSS